MSAPATSAGPARAAEVLTGDSESSRGFFERDDKRPDAEPDSNLGGGTGAQVDIDQKLVKNASLTLQLKDEKKFADAVEKVEQIARALDGYVANTASTSITFKVPTGRLDEALAAVAELGKVKHRNVRTVDVTANYVDLAIRIENLKKLRVRLQELVEAGQNVEEILHVEKELARVTSELEALEGQMRVMQNQTSFATVSVNLEERVRPGPVGWVFYGLFHGVKWLFVWD